MVEGSPRRVAVTAQESNIKNLLELAEEEDKNPVTFKSHDAPSEMGSSRWRKLRTTVQLGNAVMAHPRPLKREDSFLTRFSTRPPAPLCDAKGGEGAKAFLRLPVLNPDETPLVGWLGLVALCGLYNSWALIARQAFPELQAEGVWSALDAACDAVYCLDVAAQFRTGYLEQGIMVRDGKRLARHYAASRDFCLDVAALLPLGHLLRGVLGDSPMLRFPRFLKARRIYKFYYAVESRTAYPNLWRVANLIHVLLLLAHWFGCFYYMLSELEGFQGSWAYRQRPGESSPLVRKYLSSVYWSTLTLTTIGDLATPATNLQYLFTIISYLIGVFIFATIVGQVGNVITNRNASRLEFERLLDGAKLYMRHHKVPKGMQRRVQRWYDYSWSRGRMQGGGDINSALGILPDKLKTELAIHVNLKTLKKVSIFKECQPEFLHDLVLKMKAYIFTPGDLVCRKGEVAREMFIIADGILQVINDKGQVLTHMRAGDFFGEIGILNLDGFNRRTADVRSVGYSELFSLSREDVLSAMKDYPEAEDILQTMGRRRLLEARLNNAAEKAQDDSEYGRGKNENRQRKKGISLSHLLRKKEKETQYDIASFHSKYSNNKDQPPAKDPPPLQNSTPLFNHVRGLESPDEPAHPGVAYLMEQITSKLRRRGRIRITKKHTWWYKISNLVHLKGRAPAAPPPEEAEPRAGGVEDRRTSCLPSKPSISNWTRSELFAPPRTSPLVPRRRTLADGGVSEKKADPSPEVSPMSSNYSLTPSTTEEEQEEGLNAGGGSKRSSLQHKLSFDSVDLPPELRHVVAGIVMGIKDKVDDLILKTEKKTIEEIVQLKERIKQQDALIEHLQLRCAKISEEAGVEVPEESSPAAKSSPLNKEDSAVSSMEIASPIDLITDVKFEEEDMWLVEFPPNLPPIPAKPKLRRHSSVEVGHELPFRLTHNFLLPTIPSSVEEEEPVSPRRFSESQVRSGAIPLNKSFAAKVRRVLAKVRVNRDSEDGGESFPWPEQPTNRRSSTGSSREVAEVRHGSDGRPKRPLPTITESGSFDSLRDSPLMTPRCLQPETVVVIDMPKE